MKKKLTVLFASLSVLCLLARAAFAESISYNPCTCYQNPCICFIQLGDEGGFVKAIIQCLQEQGYVDAKTSTGIFSEEIEQAVLQFQYDNGLPRTGTMDDDTLTLLFWGMTPEMLDKMRPTSLTDTVYVPTDGGKKRHTRPTCSGMLDPRKLSIRNAEVAGFDACKKCGK